MHCNGGFLMALSANRSASCFKGPCGYRVSKTTSFPLATFVQVEADKIRSEHVYLDRQTVAEQLGLKTKQT
jgi:hypothetical protein